MGAVKSRPRLDTPERLSSRYGAVPVIYVESEEDDYVFGECWFKGNYSGVQAGRRRYSGLDKRQRMAVKEEHGYPTQP